MIKICAYFLFFQIFFYSENYDSLFKNYQKTGKIIEPTINEFQELKKHFEYIVTYYYSPTCKTCQNFKPVFKEITHELSHYKHDIPIVQFNCGDKKFQTFCTVQEKIKHLPLIRIYHFDKKIDYQHTFKKKKVLSWIKQRTVLSIKKITTSNLKKFNSLLEKEQLIILLHNPQEHKKFEKQYKEYSIVSTLFDMGLFYYTENEECYKESLSICENLKKEQVGQDQGLVLIHPDHHKCYFYQGYFDHKKLLKFFIDKEKAHIRPFDGISIDQHHYYKIPVVILFYNSQNKDVYELYDKMATVFHDHFLFTYVDENVLQGKYPVFNYKFHDIKYKQKDNIEVKHLIVDLGIEIDDQPQIYVFKQTGKNLSKKWKHQEQLNEKNLEKFLTNVQKGKEKFYSKSQKLENLKQHGKIQELSSINFKKNIEDQKMRILFVYGSKESCLHCQENYETYKELQQELLDIEELKFYSYNSQLNELDNWNFDHLPDLILINEKKEIKSYQGIMKKEQMKEFIIKELQKEIKTDELQIIQNLNYKQ